MTLAEAVLDIESRFIVHREVGEPVAHYDQQDKAIDTGARDMSRAPCGEPYITVVSGGLKAQGDRIPIYFGTEVRAVEWWRYGVMDYAETIAPEAQWGGLHLYWREEPRFESAEYVAMSQATMLGKRSALSDDLTVTLGTVWSRLLITKLAPDGTEGA